MSELDRFVGALARSLNIVAGVLSGNSLIGALGDVLGVMATFKTINMAACIQAIRNIDSAGRAELKAVFDKELVLDNAVLEAKIEAGVDLLDETVGLAEEGLLLFEKGKIIFEKAKALISA